MNPLKVYLLDDHKIIRDGIKSILEDHPSYKVTGEEGDPVVFMDILHKLDIDVVLLDLSFPKISGFQIIPRIKKMRPEIKIIILSMHNDPESMQRCMSLGAQGYIPKDSDSTQFLHALDVVTGGSTYFDNKICANTKPSDGDHLLSTREKEVLGHLANGLSSKQIAGELSISARTVETHRLNIMKKLNTTNSAETISVAAKLNLI
jgi:DNA-binding NarL/FixJ family response regulator